MTVELASEPQLARKKKISTRKFKKEEVATCSFNSLIKAIFHVTVELTSESELLKSLINIIFLTILFSNSLLNLTYHATAELTSQSKLLNSILNVFFLQIFFQLAPKCKYIILL